MARLLERTRMDAMSDLFMVLTSECFMEWFNFGWHGFGGGWPSSLLPRFDDLQFGDCCIRPAVLFAQGYKLQITRQDRMGKRNDFIGDTPVNAPFGRRLAPLPAIVAQIDLVVLHMAVVAVGPRDIVNSGNVQGLAVIHHQEMRRPGRFTAPVTVPECFGVAIHGMFRIALTLFEAAGGNHLSFGHRFGRRQLLRSEE